MKITLPFIEQGMSFPSPRSALTSPNGLLAFGGELTTSRLVEAYSNGIFPWFSHDDPILWWSPNPRGVLPLNGFHCSRSLAKLIRRQPYKVTLDLAFDQVIDNCAQIPRHDSGTWITQEMIAAYKQLHKDGYAHSIEVWDDTILVGGLYGVLVGSVFCGESMFHRKTDTSKLAFYYLVEWMKQTGGSLIDCQMQNPHLQTLGCIEISRNQFLLALKQGLNNALNKDDWSTRILISPRTA